MKLFLLCCALFGATYAQFNDAAQADILKVHNDLRSAVAKGIQTSQGRKLSAATDMLKMKWSDRLVQLAQAYANTCSDLPSGDEDYGEAIYYDYVDVKPKDLNIYGKQAALDWKSELDTIGFSNLFDQAAKDAGPGNVAQMIWSRTGFVGCGVKNCGPDPNSFSQALKIMVVCKYMEKGNNLDDIVYEEGKSCSNCPDFTACDKTTSLCQ